MFSWNTGGGGDPHRRTQSSSDAATPTTTAPIIEGSIRPPSDYSNTSNYTRQQHLDSYLKDETLARSTRKVSTGTYYYSRTKLGQEQPFLLL